MPISKSKAFNEALASIGIFRPIDVLKHLPRRYDDFSYTAPKQRFLDKERVVLLGKVSGYSRPLRFASKSLTRFTFETKGGYVYEVEAWNQNYLSHLLNSEDSFTLVGYYDSKRDKLSLSKILKGEISPHESIKPVYSLPANISNRTYSALVKRVLSSYEGKMKEIIPLALREKYRLDGRYMSYRKVHFPSCQEDIRQGLRVRKYEEALLFALKTQEIRGANRALHKDYRRKVDLPKLDSFLRLLPYKPTSDQMEAFKDCLKDMNSHNVMYRLLQGDVGTGKTLVAALCAYANHLRSEQTAFMAPTDTLARQHYENLKEIYAGTNMNLALLVGSMSNAEKHGILQDLEDGTIDMVVGTHSLFSKNVHYAYLGLAIIDEQHKFGVNQRSLLLDKGEHADLLLMSATPIPRTLTLTIYGDLDISTLSSFPSGKRDILTEILPPTSPKIRKAIDHSIMSLHRAFIVAPQIEGTGEEESSVLKVAELYKSLYPNKVTLMHGKMDEESKETAALAFKSGLCPILVATSLIEVGIDVKMADLMIVYSPTHFSLSSLHQLRGRIGRDGTQARFILLAKNPTDEAKEKLDILTKTLDGFKIAEEDLRLRGPGEVTGTKQSGLPSFLSLNIIDDFKILACARNDAIGILKNRSDYENSLILEYVSHMDKNVHLS